MAIASMTNIVIEWADVKHAFLRHVETNEWWTSQPPMARRLKRYHDNPYIEHTEGGGGQEGWEGGTPAQTLGWARHGFHAPQFAHSADMVPRSIKRRNSWNRDDGDIDIARLVAGRDDFYLGSVKREARHGLHVQLEYAFAWTVNSATIEAYGAWVAGFLASLESSGYDLVVDVWMPLNAVFTGQSREDGEAQHRTNILIRVKRQNEVSDFTEWSALFAPTGYRHLGFTAIAVAGDKVDRRINAFFGQTVTGKSWGVDYDRDDQTVMITVNQRAGGKDRFPIDKLNRQAAKAGLIPERPTALK